MLRRRFWVFGFVEVSIVLKPDEECDVDGDDGSSESDTCVGDRDKAVLVGDEVRTTYGDTTEVEGEKGFIGNITGRKDGDEDGCCCCCCCC